MSIIKVAQVAGVSKSTVSLVINNSPSVMPSTALKVRQAMESIGYVPSPREQRRGPKPNSAGNRTINITLLTLGIPAAVLRAPLYSDVLQGISAGVLENKYRLTVHNEPEAKEFDSEAILRSGADGFLIFGRGESGEASRALRDLPCVSLMGVDSPRGWCDWVSYDDAAAGRQAAAYLIERGHRACAFLGKSEGKRGQAFADAIRAEGGSVVNLDAEGLFVARDDMHEIDPKAMDALMVKLLALTPRPTAIFSWADMLTAALYPWLYQHGLYPSRDITVVSCNNEWPLLLSLHPKPAVVDIQGFKIGKRAVDQLIWRMKNRNETRVVMQLEPQMVRPEEAEVSVT